MCHLLDLFVCFLKLQCSRKSKVLIVMINKNVSCVLFFQTQINCHSLTFFSFFFFKSGKLQDMYSKGHPYPGYPGYIMMSNMNDSYMNNGSLSPPMPRSVSTNSFCLFYKSVYHCYLLLYLPTDSTNLSILKHFTYDFMHHWWYPLFWRFIRIKKLEITKRKLNFFKESQDIKRTVILNQISAKW